MTGVSSTPVLVGHPFAPIGRGEDIRCAFRSLRTAEITLPLYDIYSSKHSPDATLKEELGRHLTQRLSSAINIFHINGDEIAQALGHLGDILKPEAHNIIYPQWELSIYPEDWAKQLDRFDEIWAPSRFVFDAISQAVSRPVFHMPLATEVKLASFLGRRYFGLPEDSYLFLFYFDFSSYIDRKNPLAVIKAFERVIAELPAAQAHLVIKLNRSIDSPHVEEHRLRFNAEVKSSECRGRIIVVDRLLTDNEVKNLVRCCDCFVSLHRSEGYGRGPAEAMFLGKPVIATGYSGNLDFMTESNSCLVRYTLVNVVDGQYPYAKGQVWAAPDIDDAAAHMMRVLANRDYGRRLGEVASRHMRVHFGYRARGLRYRDRLERILLSRSTHTSQ